MVKLTITAVVVLAAASVLQAVPPKDERSVIRRCINGIPTSAQCSYKNRSCPRGSTCNVITNTCCRSFIFPPDPACPLFQRVGSCGGVVGKKCPKGSRCMYPRHSSLGFCCRTKAIPQKPVCPLLQRVGSCGGIVGKKCPKGSKCMYERHSTLGTCCKTKVIPPKPVCPLLQRVGSCGGIVGKKCPKGSKCMYERHSTLGTCCKTEVTYPKCSSGYIKGSCALKKKCPAGFYCQYPLFNSSPFSGSIGRCCQRKKTGSFPKCTSGVIKGTCGFRKRCQSGFYCQYPRIRPSRPFPFRDIGRCCQRKTPPVLTCPRGQIKRGVCGGKKGIQCPGGYKCVNNPFIVDGFGICCGRQIVHPGICPKPSPRVGICIFDPKHNCLGDQYCPKGHKCCREGCGRVCKPVISPPRPDIKLPKPVPKIPDMSI